MSYLSLDGNDSNFNRAGYEAVLAGGLAAMPGYEVRGSLGDAFEHFMPTGLGDASKAAQAQVAGLKTALESSYQRYQGERVKLQGAIDDVDRMASQVEGPATAEARELVSQARANLAELDRLAEEARNPRDVRERVREADRARGSNPDTAERKHGAPPNSISEMGKNVRWAIMEADVLKKLADQASKAASAANDLWSTISRSRGNLSSAVAQGKKEMERAQYEQALAEKFRAQEEEKIRRQEEAEQRAYQRQIEQEERQRQLEDQRVQFEERRQQAELDKIERQSQAQLEREQRQAQMEMAREQQQQALEQQRMAMEAQAEQQRMAMEAARMQADIYGQYQQGQAQVAQQAPMATWSPWGAGPVDPLAMYPFSQAQAQPQPQYTAPAPGGGVYMEFESPSMFQPFTAPNQGGGIFGMGGMGESVVTIDGKPFIRQNDGSLLPLIGGALPGESGAQARARQVAEAGGSLERAGYYKPGPSFADNVKSFTDGIKELLPVAQGFLPAKYRGEAPVPQSSGGGGLGTLVLVGAVGLGLWALFGKKKR